MEAHTRSMSAVMERESASVRAALEAADARLALRDAIREIVRLRGYPRESLIVVLDELADEYRAKDEAEHLATVVEALDLLEGNASPYAVRSYFGYSG